MMRYRNKGPPMKAVMTPTCIVAGWMTILPMLSAIISSAVPNAAEAGMRNLLSDPMTRRQM